MATKKKTSIPLKKSTQKKIATIQLDQDIWPIERDIFYRPGRMKYVRKIIKPSGCVFCHSAQKPQSLKSLCVYKTQYSQVVVNKYPYNNGHLLVLPLRHTGDLLDLTEAEYNDLHSVLRLAVKAIKAIYNPNGLNLGMNHGSTSGAGIPDHLHYHIVPRWNGDLNFFPLIAETKLVIEKPEHTYKKIQQFFKKNG